MEFLSRVGGVLCLAAFSSTLGSRYVEKIQRFYKVEIIEFMRSSWVYRVYAKELSIYYPRILISISRETGRASTSRASTILWINFWLTAFTLWKNNGPHYCLKIMLYNNWKNSNTFWNHFFGNPHSSFLTSTWTKLL